MKPLIIITVFNRKRETQATLAALEATTNLSGVELIIVDNGSTDGTAEWLEFWAEEHPGAWHRIILLDENIGCPRALNYAMCYRQPGQAMIKLDNDVEILTPRWVSRFEQFLGAVPQVAMAGPWYEELTEENRLKEKAFSPLEYYIVYPLIGHMVWHAGWFLDRVGYFDVLAEDHLYGFEDLLMCHKAATLGYELAVLPAVKIRNLQRKNALDVAGPESRDEHVERLRPEYNRRVKIIREGRYVFTDERGQPQID